MSTVITAGNATNGLSLSADNAGTFDFKTGTGAGTTAIYADASQNVGIGTTTPTAKLDLYNGGSQLKLNMTASGNGFTITNDPSYTLLQTANAVYMAFGTNGAERMRIDSNGYLLVGATDRNTYGGGANTIVSGGGVNSLTVANPGTDPYGIYVNYSTTDKNATTNNFLQCAGTTTVRASIRSNGGLANYSANNVNLSDRREKTNFAPAGNYLSKICAIPVQTFNYIDQNLEEDDGLTLGVVAQDVQAVAPELVTETDWGTKDDPKMRLSVYQTDLQYALMKCIQEQQVMIEELSAKVAALEAR